MYVVVHSLPSCMVLGRNQLHCASCSAQTAYKLVLTGSEKLKTGTNSLPQYSNCFLNFCAQVITFLLLCVTALKYILCRQAGKTNQQKVYPLRPSF